MNPYIIAANGRLYDLSLYRTRAGSMVEVSQMHEEHLKNALAVALRADDRYDWGDPAVRCAALAVIREITLRECREGKHGDPPVDSPAGVAQSRAGGTEPMVSRVEAHQRAGVALEFAQRFEAALDGEDVAPLVDAFDAWDRAIELADDYREYPLEVPLSPEQQREADAEEEEDGDS